MGEPRVRLAKMTPAIAERFGIGPACVRNALKANGITLDISRRRYDGHGGVTRASIRTRG